MSPNGSSALRDSPYKNRDAHALQKLRENIKDGFRPVEEFVSNLLAEPDAFAALAFEEAVSAGYKPTSAQIETCIEAGGSFGMRALAIAIENGYAPNVSTLDRWIKQAVVSTYSTQLGYVNAITAIVGSEKYRPTISQIDRWIVQRNAVADSAVLAAVNSGMEIDDFQRSQLIVNGSDAAINAVVASISSDSLPSKETIDAWLAPAYVLGASAKQYGEIEYTDPDQRGRLVHYDRAVTAAVEAGYKLTPEQLAFVETRTKVPEFFPANSSHPGIGRVSDSLTRTLGMPRS